MQRILDIAFSGIAIVILMPLLIPIIILLMITGEGEVFYLQERIGMNGKIFKLYKFVTMLKNSPNLTTGTITLKNDPRVLPVGRFLRKSKINELPQLLNIFLGDMSMIGPRPLSRQTFYAYSLQVQNLIEQLRPGLSGIGSIVFRHEEELLVDQSKSVDFYNDVIAPYKGLLEKWYFEHQSLKTYFLAILTTAWTVFFPKSRLVWHIFPGLPIPPDQLKVPLGYLKIDIRY